MSEDKHWELSVKHPMLDELHGTSRAAFCLCNFILELKCSFKVLAAGYFLKDGIVG